MTAASDIDPDVESGFLAVLGMIASHGAVADILAALCRYLGRPEAEPGMAFFVLRDDAWIMEARSGSGTGAGLPNPRDIADAVLVCGSGEGAHRFAGGWAHNLNSGAGEVLGMLVAFGDGLTLPVGSFAARVECACRLAVITLEQDNLMKEAAFHPEPAATAILDERPITAEVALQDTIRMIAQQRPPAEVLSFLCEHMGSSDAHRRLAFYLVHDDVWTLAARSDLGAHAEELLNQVDPPSLSTTLFSDTANRLRESPTRFGWARHLCSESGELTGMLVGFTDEPGIPGGDHATRIESICRLASLAIEQTNLIGELGYQASHDPVSGLFNRTHYRRALATALSRHRTPGHGVALIYATLDRFRWVNDVLGQAIGTRLLKHVGARFSQCLGTSDLLARIGGDEFAVIVSDTAADDDGRETAERLLRSLATPFTIDEHELFISASVGVAGSSPDSSPESLEREAYLALYHAKRSANTRLMFFQPGMSATPPERLEIERRLRGALERSEMVLFYQPQIELASNRVRGAEALMRWRQGSFGFISPAVFIPVLEETGHIVEFGRWAVHETCRQGKQWMDEAGLELRLGVNVSAPQLDRSFISDVRTILENTGFPADLLELELTESLFVGELDEAANVLRDLAGTGVRLALDDFGTGHSSLSYLQRLPFGRLKIDQSFVRIISDEEEHPPLLENIISMAANLRMSSIAEGVETAHQADLLRRFGCNEAQGFYFSHPLPAEEFVRFCHQYPSSPEGPRKSEKSVAG